MGNTQTKATNKYHANKYDRVVTLVSKGRKAELKALAFAQGKSLNQYVVDAIDAVEGRQNVLSNMRILHDGQKSVDVSNESEKDGKDEKF